MSANTVTGADGNDIEVTPAEAQELLDEYAAQLVDVREDEEWAAGHIPGARHIPLGRLTAEASTIDADRPVVFHCRVGARSLMAAEAFRHAGYDARSLTGGILRWADEQRPVDGRVADH